MISSISLRNFKCFKSLKIGLGRMNVFAGVNGAGKSTVLQSILMLRQSSRAGTLFEKKLQLRGDLIDLGTAGEVYCADPSDDWIEIAFDIPGAISIAIQSHQEKTATRDFSKEYFL